MNYHNLAASLVDTMKEVSVRFSDSCNKDYVYLAHEATLGRELELGDCVIVQVKEGVRAATVSEKPRPIIDIDRPTDLRFVVAVIPNADEELPIENHVKALAEKLKETQSQRSKKQSLSALGLTEEDARFVSSKG